MKKNKKNEKSGTDRTNSKQNRKGVENKKCLKTHKKKKCVNAAEEEKIYQEKKGKKTGHLVEVVIDAVISCGRLSELQARSCKQVSPEKKQFYCR